MFNVSLINNSNVVLKKTNVQKSVVFVEMLTWCEKAFITEKCL